MTTSADQKLSLRALIALVVGSMIGSGIFALPSAFGRATGGLGALIAWAIAGVGMLMLAFVFQTLARRKPELDAGIYAYAKAGFGEYPGFVSAVGYWIGACLADVACLILIKATLGLFFPVFGDGTTTTAIVTASLLLWAVHFMVLRGIKEAAAINTIATDRQDRADRAFHLRRHRRIQGRHLRAQFLGRRGAQLQQRGEPGAQLDAGDSVPVRRNRGRQRLFALRQEPQRCRRRHGAGLPGRALPAHPRDNAVIRRDAAAGPGGVVVTLDGRRHGSHRRTLGQGLHQHRAR